jgi:hypothetical protein
MLMDQTFLYGVLIVGSDVVSDGYQTELTGNSSLGTGDSSDKLFADRVNLLTQNQASGKPDPMQRFFHIGVKDVVMSKYHTAVITTESRGNLSLCGFGGNGRYAPQYTPWSKSLR